MRHQCLIYDGSPTQHLHSLALSIRENLERNFRCLFLNSPTMVAGMQYHLTDAGIDVAREVNKGALLLSSDDSHLVDGVFDVDRMIEMLSKAVERALTEGYQGLFATGDMTWEFGSERNFAKLLEYERALEAFLQKTPAVRGVCQYREDTLPAQAVQDALLSHQALYINETLSRINPFYSSSDSEIPESPKPAIEADNLTRAARV